MAAKKKLRGLGRGLDALLNPATLGPDGQELDGTPMRVALAELAPSPWQPRSRMDEGALYELAESIRAHGIMQPILVRALSPSARDALPHRTAAEKRATASVQYEIIAGERRYRAAELAGLDSVPVLLREVPDQTAAAMALIENMQREDLNPLEQAQGLHRLVDEFGLTHEAAARAVGRSRSATTNLLRLLQLSQPVQTMLMAGDLDMGHARALLTLEGAEQIGAATQIATRRLSVRQAEALVRKLDRSSDDRGRHAGSPPRKSADVRMVEEELSDLLSAQVEIHIKKKGRRGDQQQGELSIAFASLSELNGLIDRLRGTG